MPTPNVPDNAPIILTLDAPRAAMLMQVTSAYSCRDFQARLDYALAELIFLQTIHAAVITGSSDSAIATAAYQADRNIADLIERSIQETLNE